MLALVAYFTESRGGVIGFVIAVVVWLALSQERLMRLATVAITGGGTAILLAAAGNRPILREGLTTLRAADAIVRDELRAAGLEREIWQAFAVLTPLRSVGVQGDGRTYANLVAVRAVTSTDGMTADWARIPHDVLARISNRIVNEVPGVNRVVYDITSKPPATIEWE